MHRYFIFGLVLSILPLAAEEPAVPASPPQPEAAEAPAATPESPSNPKMVEFQKIADKLDFQTGNIVLKNGLATVNLPENLRYLSPGDTQILLEQLWGNPKGGDTLGMIFPAGISPLENKAWGVVLTFEEDGYVSDKEADEINYDKLLGEMQESIKEASKYREKEGYGTIELVGWAAKPTYDKTSHKLFWAKELEFDKSPEHTLNYNIRILGRRGVLNLNVVSGMDQLADVEAAVPTLLQATDFQEGHRYADFNPATDKLAEYGIAALVTGGVLSAATKGGLLKGLWLAVLAGKKFILIGLIACVAFVKKILFRNKAES
jgi:uncharacterized membrane-anchored protein